MNRDGANCVVAVVVTYNPDLARLIQLVNAITPQVVQVIAFDNTADGGAKSIWDDPSFKAVTVCGMGRNLGLAGGLNRGIEKAIGYGADQVLLLDQDSVAGPEMVASLQNGINSAQTLGFRVAAAGPNFTDSQGQVPPAFLAIGFPVNRPVAANPDKPFVLTDILITSGMLLKVRAFIAVGPMMDALFIDNVDIEWGFRAVQQGWVLIGVPSAMLCHRMGEIRRPPPKWIKYFGRSNVIQHQPMRLYYIMRNRILLLRMSHVPWRWKLQDLLRIPFKVIVSLQTAEDRRLALKAIIQGLWHGVVGRTGPRP